MVRILKDESNRSGKFGHAYVSGADPVNRHLAFGRSEQTVEILDKRGLSCTVLPHYGDEFPVFDRYRHAFQGFNASWIREVDVFDFYRCHNASRRYCVASSELRGIPFNVTPFSSRSRQRRTTFGMPTPRSQACSELNMSRGSPSSTILPSSMIMTWLAYFAAKSNLCSTSMTVIPSCLLSWLITSKIF